MALLRLKGVFGVFRIHQKIKVEFPTEENPTPMRTGRRRRLPRWLYRLGATDQMVQWFKPKKAPNWIAATQYAELPESLVVPELRYLVGRPGFRTKEVTLVTTLRDADLYPLLDLAELYRQRWQVEKAHHGGNMNGILLCFLLLQNGTATGWRSAASLGRYRCPLAQDQWRSVDILTWLRFCALIESLHLWGTVRSRDRIASVHRRTHSCPHCRSGSDTAA